MHDEWEREILGLPWSVYRAAVVVEVHRVRCPECGVRVEKDRTASVQSTVQQALGSDRRGSLRGRRQPGGAAFPLPETTLRAIDLRYLERWDQRRRKPALKQMGVDEIYRGRNDKFLTVVNNLETGEPLWFGKKRKQETLDE